MRPLLLGWLLVLALPALAQEKVREPEITDEDRKHWSFVPPKMPTGDGIDHFIREKLQAKGLKLSPTADKATLLRRVSFDLTGLPPTVEELDAFLKDSSATAYEKVVDRLLGSQHFGERWAQHWLDVVRFAETNGYELDAERPHAWRYRDYVVRSFNADKPYRTFLREQIAGDELAAGKDPKDVAELLIATGMHRCGPSHVVSGNLDKEMIRQEYLTEMLSGIGSAVLGITLQCARCHNHKTDPISAADYYRVQAFFAAAQYKDINLSTKEEKEAYDKKVADINARTAPFKKQTAELDAPIRAKVAAAKKASLDKSIRDILDLDAKKRTPEQEKIVKNIQPVLKVSWDEILEAMPPDIKAKRDAIRQQMFAIQAEMPPVPAGAWTIADDAKRPPTHILRRGDWSKKGAVVERGFPRVLTKEGTEPKSRTEFADWLTSPDHPLTSRVIVNRLWHHYFGKGIVRSVNDFGITGDKPSHPELLDWLALDLTKHGWKLKRIHKMIVMSDTYRQETGDSKPGTADPDNRLLSRQNRKRLDAEAIRDAMLTASGTLNRQTGGVGVRVPLEPEVYDLIFTEGEPDGLWTVTPDAKQHTRRSIYLFAKRNVRLPILEAFDQPDTLTPCTGRNVSTFAPQALILMNGPFTHDASRHMAGEILAKEPDVTKALNHLYRRAVGRETTPEERKVLTDFWTKHEADFRTRLQARENIGLPNTVPTGIDPARLAAFADVCLAVLNSNEFIHVR